MRFSGLILLVCMLWLVFSGPAQAACTTPAGSAGEIIYNTTNKIFQYCNDTSWIRMNQPGSGSGGCTAPAAAEGEMIYNEDARVLQGCAGNVHKSFGPVGGSESWVQLSVDHYADVEHGCAINTSGKLYCWGRNDTGVVGDGTTDDRERPVTISGGGTWKTVSVRSGQACGIKGDDTAWCWGGNGSGAVGDNTIIQRNVPTAVSGGGTWKAISTGGAHSCGIKSDDTLWCWGDNGFYQLGDNTTTDRLVPTAVSGGGTWKAISAGSSYSCGIKIDDTLWCWGNNSYGRMGIGATVQSGVPVQVTGGGAWKFITAKSFHSCGIKSDDTLWCWGRNNNGAVGDNTIIDRDVPTAVNGGGAWKYAGLGIYHSCGIKSDDTLWCWGSRDSGMLGDGYLSNMFAPSYTSVPTAVLGGGSWQTVGGGQTHTCGIKKGQIYCWGARYLGPTDFLPRPITGGGWKQASMGMAHGCGIKTDDTAWCWGMNSTGELGDGLSVSYTEQPVAVSGGGSWKEIGASNYIMAFTCGIKSDDTLWCWGAINFTTVPTLFDGGAWKKIAVGMQHFCAIKSDDTLWCTGDNTYGQLGDGTTTTPSGTFVQVSGGGTWKAVDAGFAHSCGIKSDDTVWCWGYNAEGELGDNSIIDRLVPTAVSGGGTWVTVSAGYMHSCGVKFDDTIWCWGDNTIAQLGDNSTTSSLIPVTISGGGTWKTVGAGAMYSCGIKTDHSLWCWGGNTYGELGDGGALGPISLVPVSFVGGGSWDKTDTGFTSNCPLAFSGTPNLYCTGPALFNLFGGGNILDVVPAAEGCGNPTSRNGDIRYNADANVLQYCDGAGWVGVRN